ncbi:MAG TPA: BatD family protein [bacterium]|nr:BatD family protein [bacterium]
MWIRTGSLILIILLALTTAASAARDQVRLELEVQPRSVLVGDSVEISIVVEGDRKAQPQLEGAEAFRIVGTQSGSSVRIINGVISISNTFTYTAVAQRAGTATLTATLKQRGRTLRSEPVSVLVAQAGQAPATPPPSGSVSVPTDAQGRAKPMFMRAILSADKPYVGEQLTVEYRVYIREGVRPRNFSLNEVPEFTGFVAHELITSNRLNFEGVTIDDTPYRAATVKRYALFPVAPGEASIGSLGMQMSVARTSRGRGWDPFEDFFDLSQGRTVQTASQPVSVTVLPLPAAGRPADWREGVGTYKVSAQLDRGETAVGEPVELKIVVEGYGNVDSIPRPQLALDEAIRVYSEKAKPEVVAGYDLVSSKKTFEIILIAAKPGEYEIPAIRVPFWDPKEKGYRVATTAPLRFTATGEAEAAQPQAPGVLSREAIELRGRDLRYIRGDKQSLRPAHKPWSARPAVWIILGLWPLLVLGVTIHQIRVGRLRADRRSWRSRRALREAKQRLTEARALLAKPEAARFYAELHRAVLGFIADKLDAAAPGFSPDELAARLDEAGVSDETIGNLRDLWREADHVRFAGQAADQKRRKDAYGRARDLLADLARELER